MRRLPFQEPPAPADEGTVSSITETIDTAVGIDAATQGQILLSLVAVIVIWALHHLALRTIGARLETPRARYRWGKGSGYVAFLVALLILGQIWVEALRGLGTFLGLLSAGLAIALRDLVASLAGWAFILMRHPFVVGDRIQIGEHQGDVVDIRLFQFTLLEIGNWVDADQSTGRVIHVPNGRVFTDPLANYTVEFSYLWHEIPVRVTFESNWKKAKEILEAIALEHAGGLLGEAEAAVNRASRKFLIFYGKMTPKVYTGVKENGVELTLRFLCPVRERRGITERMWESTLEAFAQEPDIDLAYPTQRLFTNMLEGKEGARAEVPPALGLSETNRPGGRSHKDIEGGGTS